MPGLYTVDGGSQIGLSPFAFDFKATGNAPAEKLRGLGQSPRVLVRGYYAMLSVISPHIKHASSLAIAVAATFLFVLFVNVIL